jgi:hypothetical protein
MTFYAAMFAFGLVLLGSWAGWGALLQRLFLERVAASRALQAAWGLALTLAVGGLMNVAGQVTPHGILLFVTTGFALFLWDGYRDRKRLRVMASLAIRRLRRDRPLALAVAVLLGLSAALYAASICSTRFNDHDDLQAYFVFPAKMVQTGALGPDPYSERRMLSLGGMSFLHAIVLSVADAKYLRIVDPGVSLLLSAALLAGIARVARTGCWAAAGVVCLFLLVPPPADNTTSSLTGFALFLALLLTLERIGAASRHSERPAYLGSVLVALLASGLCSLKTTHVPATLLLVLAAYSIGFFQSRNPRGVLLEATLAGALTALFLAPWMVSLNLSNGTPFFPFLGRGFHGSAYGTYWRLGTELTPQRASGLLVSPMLDLLVVPLIVLGAAALHRSDLGARRPLLVGWAFVATVCALLMPIASGGVDASYRYSHAFLYAATFTLALFAFSRRRSEAVHQPRVGRARLLGALAMAILLARHSATLPSYVLRQWTAIGEGLEASKNPHFMLRYVRRYNKMQEAVPEGATVLTRLQYPFLLDFRRNQVFIADYPGGSSPPPGMPFFEGPERLAEYLCRRPVRYVAYSYRNEAGFYEGLFQERLRPGTDPWLRLQALHTRDFQRNLSELGTTRKSLYDDGDVFVLDLGASSDGRPLSCVPW